MVPDLAQPPARARRLAQHTSSATQVSSLSKGQKPKRLREYIGQLVPRCGRHEQAAVSEKLPVVPLGAW
jgi:hypothetical protein